MKDSHHSGARDELAKEKKEQMSTQEETRRGMSHGSQGKEVFQEAQKAYVGDPGKWSHVSTQGCTPKGLVGLLAHITFYSFLVIVSIQKQVHLFPNRWSSYQSWCIFQRGN